MTDEALPRPATADRTALDRFLAAIPLASGALIILMILFWEAAVRKTPTIFSDELKWTQLSRGIAATGHAARRGEPTSFQSLYSFLIAPWWWLHSTSAAYTAIKYVNVAVMSTAAIPVYFLARRLTSPVGAAVAALGALCTSAFFYATFLLPEVLAYPTFCLCAYVCVRALAGGGRRWTIGAIAACAIAVEVRGELVGAGAAFGLAAVVLWLVGPRGKKLLAGWSRADRLGAGLLALGALILLNSLLSSHSDVWAVVTQNYKNRAWHLGLEAGSALAIGLGVLPAVAGLASLWLPERRDDSTWRAFAAFLGSSIVTFGTYTGIKAAYLTLTFGTYVEERNMIYLSPLLIVGAVVYFSARRPSLGALALSAAFCGWLVIAHPYQLLYPYFEAPGYGIVAMANRAFRWDQPTIRLALEGTLALSILLSLVPFVRSRLGRGRPIVLGIAALAVATWGLAGEVTSARGSSNGANQLAANLPHPFDWIDRATNQAGTTFIGQDISSGQALGINLAEFWNRSLRNVWSIDGSAPGPGPSLTPDLRTRYGELSNDPGLPYVVASDRVNLIGPIVASRPGVTLRRIEQHPWRLKEASYGVSNDGWIAGTSDRPIADGRYAYFGPETTPGTLTIDVNRRGFCADTAPPTHVTLRVGPLALNQQRAPIVSHATRVVRFLLPNCGTKILHLTMTPPFAVQVRAAPTVRLTDYGLSDSRELGAQVGFSFSPKR